MTRTDHLKVLLVAGARPNFMKIAPIIRALRAAGDDAVLVNTGLHYDAAMSQAIFHDLDIPEPNYRLGVTASTHAVQTAKIMEAFEPVLVAERPNWVVVAGDSDSALAAALVTAKLKHTLGCRIAHVEAGLRSNDWRTPEEVNRVIVDRLSDLLLTPSTDVTRNIEREGIPADRVHFVGNAMIDTLMTQIERARGTNTLERLGLRRRHYVAATLHLASTVDDRQALEAVLDGLARVAESLPVVLPLHPRTRKNIERFNLHAKLAPLVILELLPYPEMLALIDGAQVVLTDSGGIQEETTALGVPCVTLREQTERPITITHGTNRLAPWPLTAHGINSAYVDALESAKEGALQRPAGWDGHAAERIVEALTSV